MANCYGTITIYIGTADRVERFLYRCQNANIPVGDILLCIRVHEEVFDMLMEEEQK